MSFIMIGGGFGMLIIGLSQRELILSNLGLCLIYGGIGLQEIQHNILKSI